MLSQREVQNIIIGKRSKASGAFFEKMIDAGCEYYEKQGIAKIEKQNEPVHYIRPYGKSGQFIANYAKKSGVDYKGIAFDGVTVCFEAKHTDGEKMLRSRVEPHQMEYLKKYADFGAQCFILVSFNLTDFYRIPFLVWEQMKTFYGRQYITKADVEKYRIEHVGKVLKFLSDKHLREVKQQ